MKMATKVKLSNAQWGALHQLADFGPIEAKEIVMPPAMDGSRRTKLDCHYFTAATLSMLETAGLVAVMRNQAARPTNACGKAGHQRIALVIHITDEGRNALEGAAQ